MKPSIKIASARTPGGNEISLYQHDRDFSIRIDGQNLMHSRLHASELALARLGCAHLVGRRGPAILIGGLGMGYTLRQALDMLDSHARVEVSELLGVVVEWNRKFLGVLNGRPLEDGRVVVEPGDVVERISQAVTEFDAILLDIDNGPSALTDPGNHRLYGHEGIQACRHALRDHGCLALWSVEASPEFEKILMLNGFHVRRFRVSADMGAKSKSRVIWVASEDKDMLPPGGNKPHPLNKDDAKGHPARSRKKR